MAVNKIVYNGQTYTGDLNLMAGNLFLENSLANDELTVDTLTATIDGSAEIGTLYVPKGSSGYLTADGKLLYVLPYIRILVDDLSQYIYGEPVLYYRDDVLMGKFYMSSSKRVSKYSFEINCVSAIGLLDNTKHYGGIYNGTPMKDLLADIIGGIIPYTLDPIFLNLPVFGWLPVATRRENLHQLLFAEGATIKKDANADIVFTYLKSGAATEISDDRIFIGGSVDYSTPVDTVKVLEHSYIAYENQELTSLYEDYVPDNTITTPNGNTVTGALVLFDKPMFNLTVENGTILEQGANYAVLQSGGFCKLFGKTYAHTTRETIEKKPVTRGLVSIVDNTATIDNATLVSLVNGENVAKRALAYYGYAKTVNADIVVQNERPGDIVSFNDPFGESQTGFIQAMNSNMGGLYRANAKLVSGFIPTNPGNFYNNFVILTGNGIWNVPLGVTKIRVVTIGGGSGGNGGLDGERGKYKDGLSYDGNTIMPSTQDGDGGKGGNYGNGGAAGKVYEREITVLAEQKITYSCGFGGSGGSKSGGLGSLGTNTLFGKINSGDGSIPASGYIDMFTQKNYALPGKIGILGGNGGSTFNGSKPGNNVENYKGGTYGYSVSSSGTNSYSAQGGGGGGAAYGSDGSPGINASVVYGKYNVNGREFTIRVTCGTGGNGASPKDAELSPNSTYGSGGNGGHGGGGGGNQGGRVAYGSAFCDTAGRGGLAGIGSAGSNGAPGCVFVYY